MRTQSLWLLAAVAVFGLLAQDDDPGKIMRPADKSAHSAGPIDIVATAPSGKLELDGRPIEVAQPFPNVFHGVLKVAPGEHSLVLIWEAVARKCASSPAPTHQQVSRRSFNIRRSPESNVPSATN